MIEKVAGMAAINPFPTAFPVRYSRSVNGDSSIMVRPALSTANWFIAMGMIAIKQMNDPKAASESPLWMANGPMSMRVMGLRITKAKIPTIRIGESRIERPRGVRSPRRRCASATADAPADSPGSVRPHAARVVTTLRAPVEPGDSSTFANTNKPTACRISPETASAPSAAALARGRRVRRFVLSARRPSGRARKAAGRDRPPGKLVSTTGEDAVVLAQVSIGIEQPAAVDGRKDQDEQQRQSQLMRREVSTLVGRRSTTMSQENTRSERYAAAANAPRRGRPGYSTMGSMAGTGMPPNAEDDCSTGASNGQQQPDRIGPIGGWKQRVQRCYNRNDIRRIAHTQGSRCDPRRRSGGGCGRGEQSMDGMTRQP